MNHTLDIDPTAKPRVTVEVVTTGQLLLPAPPATRSGRAASIMHDRWNALRNDMRLIVEDHMFAAPVIALAAGFLTGRLLTLALRKPRQDTRGW